MAILKSPLLPSDFPSVCVNQYLLTKQRISLYFQGGIYVFEIFNQYGAAGWCIYLTATAEFIAIGWCYGAKRYLDNIEDMIGSTFLRPFLTITWKYTGPFLCLVSIYQCSCYVNSLAINVKKLLRKKKFY